MSKEIKLPFDSAELTEDFQSGDAERVAHALKTLEAARTEHCYIPLPLPEPDCLESFGDVVPEEMLHLYLFALQHYPDFDPTPSGIKIRESLVEAVISYSHDWQSPYDVAMYLKIDDSPRFAVSDALNYLLHRGMHTPAETLAATRLVDNLLGSDATRKATVELLREFALTDDFGEIIKAIWPRLEEEERLRLDVSDEKE